MKELGIQEPPAKKKELPTKEERGYSSTYLKRLDAKEIDRQILNMDSPADAYGAAMYALGTGAKVNPSSFKSETGGSQRDAFGNNMLDKKAPSVEVLAGNIWQSLPEYVQEYMTDMEIRDALIDILGTYRSKNQVASSFIDMYVPKEFEDMAIEDAYVNLGEGGVMEKGEWESWMNSEADIDMSAKLEPEVIEDLIKKYEQESTAKGEVAPERAAGEVAEGAGRTVKPEEAGEDIARIRERAEPAELDAYESYKSRNLADEAAFTAEYEQNRIAEQGETREQYLLRKYCQEG